MPLADLAQPPTPVEGEIVVDGIGVSPGVAIGPAYVYAAGAYQASRESLSPEAVEAEVERFERAVARSERELRKITTIARRKLSDDSAGIFEAQRMVLRDSQFFDRVVAAVRERQMGAGWAVQEVIGALRTRMNASASPVLRDRADDFLDVQNRVLRNLQQGRAVSRIDRDHVVVARALTAADVLLFSRHGVLGCVIDHGGPAGHVAIMARALGIPSVAGVPGLAARVSPGDEVIVDGFSGRVVVNPSAETRARYAEKQHRVERLDEDRAAIVAAPSETADGVPIALRANVELPEELPTLAEYGAEGVGLFRTEMLFLTQGRALEEEQQLDVYREAVRAAAPHAVTFRLLDLGGDKVLPMAHREDNPFLGWRGLRILLDKPDLLRPQLRAILRAAVDAPDEAPPRIMLPMVSDLDEVRTARAAIRDAAAALDAEGVPHRAGLPVGIMVEVPSVALMAERFARLSDFFSIGTNDLTQFTLAVDRGNSLVASRFRELDPSVLTLIARTVEAAQTRGIPVSVCGEMAGDPRVTPLLVGLGVTALSASPAYLALVKRVLRETTITEARDLALRALRQPDADAVGRLLDYWMQCHNRELAALLATE